MRNRLSTSLSVLVALCGLLIAGIAFADTTFHRFRPSPLGEKLNAEGSVRVTDDDTRSGSLVLGFQVSAEIPDGERLAVVAETALGDREIGRIPMEMGAGSLTVDMSNFFREKFARTHLDGVVIYRDGAPLLRIHFIQGSGGGK